MTSCGRREVVRNRWFSAPKGQDDASNKPCPGRFPRRRGKDRNARGAQNPVAPAFLFETCFKLLRVATPGDAGPVATWEKLSLSSREDKGQRSCKPVRVGSAFEALIKYSYRRQSSCRPPTSLARAVARQCWPFPSVASGRSLAPSSRFGGSMGAPGAMGGGPRGGMGAMGGGMGGMGR